MNERWNKIEEVFVTALAHNADTRESYVEKECGADLSLRAEVASLLASHEQAGSFIEAPAVAFVSELLLAELTNDEEAADAASSVDGQRVGNYEIEREIGRGGMGTVYLAHRADDQYKKLVAIKIVRRGMDTTDIVRRFRNERQILASLEHTNIARLLDGGTTADGVPYIVMEYVEGVAITNYCDAHKLKTSERLQLFRTVCAAVQYAHQNLVVHRDLKPSNILVTAAGEPKLLDFGIAKLLSPEMSAETSEHTLTELRILTPAYASPEQIRGQMVTTASDVYSLGIVLYELLTRARPFDFEGKSIEQIIKTVTEFKPGLPSRVARRAGETGSVEAWKKEFDASALKGDLDNIVLMALRPEPERRYKSVEAFAADIKRHLEGLPVSARPNTFQYRAAKFVGRNKVAVAAAAFVVLSLLVGLGLALWQASVAREKARSAAENQTKAELAAAKSKKITGFIESILSYANPAWYAEGNKLNGQARVIDVLNEFGEKIETEFPRDLDIQAELHHKCAEIYLNNRMPDRAEHHARRALELRRQIFGERDAGVAKDLYYLGSVSGLQGKHLEYEKMLRQAAAIFREVAPDDANLPYLLENIGDNEADSYGDYDAAEKLYSEALELFRRKDGDAHFNTARLYFTLSINAARQGNAARADALFSEGEGRVNQSPDESARLSMRIERGELEFVKGNASAAEALLKQAMAESRKAKGENSPLEQDARRYLIEIYEREKEWAKAAVLEQARIAAMEKTMPETSIIPGTDLASLSAYLLRASRKAAAKPFFEKAYRIFQAGKRHEEASLTLQTHIGECLLLFGRREEALPLLEESGAFYKANYPANYREAIRTENLLASSNQNRPL